MKKIIFILFIISFKLNSQEINLSKSYSGEYVYYKTNSDDFGIGILGIVYLNDNLFRIRVSNNKIENFIIDIPHSINKQAFKISSYKIIHGDIGKEYLNIILEELQRVLYNRKSINISEFPNPIKDLNETSYNFWTPCIQLFQENDHSGNSKIELIGIGKMSSPTDNTFYTYSSKSRHEVRILNKITTSNMVDKEADSVKFKIYENWEHYTDEYKSNFYRLKEFTGQDAILLIEKIDLKKINITDIFTFYRNYLIIPNSNILLDSIKIIQDEYPTLIYKTFNDKSKYITIQKTKPLNIKNGVSTTVTLAVYKDLYLKNKNYFDTIWDSIEFN